MPHDGPHHGGWALATPDQLAFAASDGEVLVRIEGPHEVVGVIAGIELRLSPTEARQVAAALSRKADEAER